MYSCKNHQPIAWEQLQELTLVSSYVSRAALNTYDI